MKMNSSSSIIDFFSKMDQEDLAKDVEKYNKEKVFPVRWFYIDFRQMLLTRQIKRIIGDARGIEKDIFENVKDR